MYVLPPIRYPDGTIVLKLGGRKRDDPHEFLASAGDVVRWYRSAAADSATAVGDPGAADAMAAMLHSLVPGLSPIEVRSDAGADGLTCTGRPFIGAVADGLFVATGGCGLAAKSADEIGRLGAAAALSPSGWAEDETTLQAADFEPRLELCCA